MGLQGFGNINQNLWQRLNLFLFIVKKVFLIKTTKNEICKNVEIFGQI